MRTIFQTGDRVAVYDRGYRYVGTVDGYEDDVSALWVWLDKPGGRAGTYVAPEQCRKLKQRAPRRRIWISEAALTNYTGVACICDNGPAFVDSIEFIEVRKK